MKYKKILTANREESNYIENNRLRMELEGQLAIGDRPKKTYWGCVKTLKSEWMKDNDV